MVKAEDPIATVLDEPAKQIIIPLIVKLIYNIKFIIRGIYTYFINLLLI